MTFSDSRWPMRSKRQAVALLLFGALLGCAAYDRGDDFTPPEVPNSAPDPGDGSDGGDNGDGSMSLSYASDIQTLVIADCSECHASDGQASGTELLYVDSTDEDYQTTLQFIDESNPSNSRLLTKASGGGHGGGAVYPETSDEYQTVLTWIEGGALP